MTKTLPTLLQAMSPIGAIGKAMQPITVEKAARNQGDGTAALLSPTVPRKRPASQPMTDVRYMHIRNEAEDAAITHVTVAYTRSYTDTVLRLTYAVALCRAGDQFVKKVGRHKAAGRLKAKKNFLLYGNHLQLEASISNKEINEILFDEVVSRFL